MKIFKDIKSFRDWRKSQSGTIGFIPTMGALHEGHLSLIEKSKRNCNITVISIFVNPLQFNNIQDLENYPNKTDDDLLKLKLKKVDAVFLPNKSIMYPKNSSTIVQELTLSNSLEGQSRPGHFKGVTTIVSKLFNIIKPTHAYFGKKDAQQLRIIQRMVQDLNFDIEIIPCKTLREKSGLAFSSRNQNLALEYRKKANIIKKGLDLAKISLNNGEKSATILKNIISSKINSEPEFDIIYISVAESNSLKELENIQAKEILISVAVKIDGIRLIDNFTYSS
ncbi:MAG: pantoate--beta-alanine ligase [Candidatus Marinimicrobia bacterium]|nr:pantoate--beta-alanine ligase [Candidatus Neomarinimicrobiota bacterium]|tara:strand:+ start:4648 stop:5487 length:840 start_codon:yes stop_codon:yes gene_type:complete